MNITRENIDQLNATITVAIDKTDYAEKVENILKDYRRKANVPGFRPGHVPAGMIRKMYWKPVLLEEVNKILSESLSNYITEEKLNILGEPLPNEEQQLNIDWDNLDSFNFVFDVCFAPEFEIKLDKRTKYPYYSIQADDETVQKQVDAYLLRFGFNEKVDSAGVNDTLRGDFVQLNEQGQPLEGGIKAEKVVIAVDLMKDKAVQDEFIGKKEGDVVVFDPVKTFQSKHEVGHMLNISHAEAEKLEGNFSFTIIEILRYKKAELNAELYKKIYGEDTEIADEASFRAKVKSEIEESLKYSSEYKFALDARKTLVEKTNMELPDAFLKRWLLTTNKELSQEQIEKDYDHFIEDLRWQLIKDKLVTDNEIKVLADDVKAMAREMTQMQFRQYGMNYVPEEYLDSYANQMLSKEEDQRRIFMKVQEDKLIELIKSKVNVDVKEVSEAQFNSMFEK